MPSRAPGPLAGTLVVDLTRVLAEEDGLAVDEDGFRACMERQRAASGNGRHVGGGLVVAGNPPLAQTGAGHDPVIGGVHHRFQLGVGQHPLRHVVAGV